MVSPCWSAPSEQYEKTLGRAMEGDGAGLARASLPAINAQLIAVERTLTLPDGLPGRPWYRNQIYAPGLYTGYGVKTLPGVRESIEEKQWKLAEEQAVRVGKVLENCRRENPVGRRSDRAGRAPMSGMQEGRLKLGCSSISVFLGQY